MVPTEGSSVFLSRPGSPHPDSDPLRSVVWVGGEHHLATRVHLSATIAEAARLDDADIVVDLSGVTFMDASTIGALIVARNRLRDRSRSLSVRNPSPLARRLLDVCGLALLIDESPAGQPPVSSALGSWVDVPTSRRASDSASTPSPQGAPSQRAGRNPAPQPGEPTGAHQPRGAPS